MAKLVTKGQLKAQATALKNYIDNPNSTQSVTIEGGTDMAELVTFDQFKSQTQKIKEYADSQSSDDIYFGEKWICKPVDGGDTLAIGRHFANIPKPLKIYPPNSISDSLTIRVPDALNEATAQSYTPYRAEYLVFDDNITINIPYYSTYNNDHIVALESFGDNCTITAVGARYANNYVNNYGNNTVIYHGNNQSENSGDLYNYGDNVTWLSYSNGHNYTFHYNYGDNFYIRTTATAQNRTKVISCGKNALIDTYNQVSSQGYVSIYGGGSATVDNSLTNYVNDENSYIKVTKNNCTVTVEDNALNSTIAASQNAYINRKGSGNIYEFTCENENQSVTLSSFDTVHDKLMIDFPSFVSAEISLDSANNRTFVYLKEGGNVTKSTVTLNGVTGGSITIIKNYENEHGETSESIFLIN